MRTRDAALAGLLAGTLLLTGCGGGDGSTVGSGTDAGSDSGEASAPFNDVDVAFVAGMVPHHDQAVEMADLVLDKDPSEPVRGLAERIQAAQEPEIEQLESLLETYGEEPAEGGHGGHGGGSGAGGHAGMMTDQQMQQLEAATGVEAERLFLTLMVEHHRGAVEAADTQIADGEHAPAIELARSIRDAQTAEISEMEQLLRQL